MTLMDEMEAYTFPSFCSCFSTLAREDDAEDASWAVEAKR